jgi:hypothetical protein
MGWVNTCTLTVPIMKVLGSEISSMAKARRAGRMDRYLLESTKMGRKLASARTNGQMEPAMKANGSTTK